MLKISISKVAQIIAFGHELDRAEAELRGFLDALDQDEQEHLIALMWVGRGVFEPEDFAEAVATVQAEASTPTADYLIGTPHFPDHLEAGLEAMGVDESETA